MCDQSHENTTESGQSGKIPIKKWIIQPQMLWYAPGLSLNLFAAAREFFSLSFDIKIVMLVYLFVSEIDKIRDTPRG